MIEQNQFPIEVTSHIQQFRTFLNSSWESLDALMHDHNWHDDGRFTDDWLQVNWEFLVERELLGGNGFLPALEWNKRITFPNTEPQYIISCVVQNGIELKDFFTKQNNYKNEELMLLGFCTPVKTTYGLYPPFDYVEMRTVDRKKRYVAPISHCHFFLKSLSIVTPRKD